MNLMVTRLNQGKYETVVTRDDGASYRLKGVAHMFAIPHDLAHFVVEKTLRPHQGFFRQYLNAFMMYTAASGLAVAFALLVRGRKMA